MCGKTSRIESEQSKLATHCLDSDLHDSGMGFARCSEAPGRLHIGRSLDVACFVDFPGSPWALYSSKCGGLLLLLLLGRVSVRAHGLGKTVRKAMERVDVCQPYRAW